MSDSGSAVGQSAPDVRAESFSYWRVWVDQDAGTVRVARDRYTPVTHRVRPEHLEETVSGRLIWQPHERAARIPSLPLLAFTTYLEQGGK